MTMQSTNVQLRQDALAIWHAGVSAVDAAWLVKDVVHVEQRELRIGELTIPLQKSSRLCVVGAGKAAASMAVGLESALGEALLTERLVFSWVNVPDNCVVPTSHLHLHPARPAGHNEPTPSAVAGTEEILKAVAELGPDDICFVLISGGGSALLAAPLTGITLEDKLAISRTLVDRGADIRELNAVRRALSRVKGGGLAAACTAGTTVSLIISDVLGDPIDIIASGPTCPPTQANGLEVAHRLLSDSKDVTPAMWAALAREAARPAEWRCNKQVHNLVIGNLGVALRACAAAAAERGYQVRIAPIDTQQPDADSAGIGLFERARRMGREPASDVSSVAASQPSCWRNAESEAKAAAISN